MTTKYRAKGDSVAWTNDTGSAVAANSVVELSHTIGVAAGDIPNGEAGTVYIEGVFELPKVSAAVFAVGEKLIWDTSAGGFDDSSATPATGDITGGAVAMAAGANTETVCTVKLTPGNATLA
jgi:predicted RecA/RadA family phage recombinase